MHPYDHYSIIYNHQATEAKQVSMDKWVDKEDVVHMFNRTWLSHKK